MLKSIIFFTFSRFFPLTYHNLNKITKQFNKTWDKRAHANQLPRQKSSKKHMTKKSINFLAGRKGKLGKFSLISNRTSHIFPRKIFHFQIPLTFFVFLNWKLKIIESLLVFVPVFCASHSWFSFKFFRFFWIFQAIFYHNFSLNFHQIFSIKNKSQFSRKFSKKSPRKFRTIFLSKFSTETKLQREKFACFYKRAKKNKKVDFPMSENFENCSRFQWKRKTNKKLTFFSAITNLTSFN